MKSLSETVDDYLAELRFSASDTFEATGVSLTAQRDLRRRKFMPPIEGHARFDVENVARLAVIASLGQLGIGPKDASTFAEKAARAVTMRFMILERRTLLSALFPDDSDHDNDHGRFIIWCGGSDYEVSDTPTLQSGDDINGAELSPVSVVIDCDALARRIGNAKTVDTLTYFIKASGKTIDEI